MSNENGLLAALVKKQAGKVMRKGVAGVGGAIQRVNENGVKQEGRELGGVSAIQLPGAGDESIYDVDGGLREGVTREWLIDGDDEQLVSITTGGDVENPQDGVSAKPDREDRLRTLMFAGVADDERFTNFTDGPSKEQWGKPSGVNWMATDKAKAFLQSKIKENTPFVESPRPDGAKPDTAPEAEPTPTPKPDSAGTLPTPGGKRAPDLRSKYTPAALNAGGKDPLDLDAMGISTVPIK